MEVEVHVLVHGMELVRCRPVQELDALLAIHGQASSMVRRGRVRRGK
jgi:hypothetical protein